MALRTKPQIKATHRLALTPGLRQSMTLLALPTPDLVRELDAEAQTNPFLRLEFPNLGRGGAPDYVSAAEQIATPVTLGASIRQQLGFLSLDDDVSAAATYMTGELTDEGYLACQSDEVADVLGLAAHIVDKAIAAIQSCEPTGVGARDLPECLLLQLSESGLSRDLCILATENLSDLANGNWRIAAKNTGLTQDALMDLASRIRQLTPRPTDGFAPPTRHVTPDIIVERGADNLLSVSLVQGQIPLISIDQTLATKTKNATSDSSWADIHLQRAEALARAVRFRNQTLLRIAETLIARQSGFFYGRLDQLSPLTQSTLAGDLSLGPSTISRAMAAKYLQFGGATYPFSYFTSPSASKNGASPISAFTVQRHIQKLIAAESTHKPLSDSEIQEKLMIVGVDIARRTVAKYRGCMNIPSSFERRRQMPPRRTRPVPPGSVNSLKR